MLINQSNTKDFVGHLNAKHHNIKFAHEFEEKNSFAFMNIKIACIHNKLVRLVFCNPEFIGNFHESKELFAYTIKTFNGGSENVFSLFSFTRITGLS